MAAEAQNLGIVIDRDLLTRAEEMNDQMSTAARVMDAEFKKALIDLAPFLVDTARLAAGLARAFADIVDTMRDLENQSTRGLNNHLKELGMERLDIERQILEAQDAQRNNTSVIAGAEGKLDMGVLRLKDKASEISKQEAEILAILGSRDSGTVTTPKATASDSVSIGGTKTGSSRNKAAEAALREAEAVKALIADLQAERDEIGMSDVEREKSRALRQAGAAATKEQKLAIVDLIDAINAETEAQRGANEAADFFKDLTNQAFDGLIPKIKTGNDALDQFVNTLIKAVAQAVLLGEGPLASLFGGGGGIMGAGGGGGQSILGTIVGALAKAVMTVFMPSSRFADGTNFAPGGMSLVGERGPELVNLPRGSQVHTAGATSSILAPANGNGGRTTVNIINNAGVEAKTEKRRSPNGDEIVEVILEKVKSDMGDGGFDSTIGGRFGSKPVRVRRGGA